MCMGEVCVFAGNENLSSLVLAGQMFSTMDAYKDGSWLISLAYAIYHLFFLVFDIS